MTRAFGSEEIDGKQVTFGFSTFRDWLESVVLSFPAPWSIAPFDGMYYGTVVQDARGVAILSFWQSCGGPSERQKQYGWDPKEDPVDNHWESEQTLDLASYVVASRNNINEWSDEKDRLVSVILENASWEPDVWGEIQCGGPDRRSIEPKSREVRKMLGMEAGS